MSEKMASYRFQEVIETVEALPPDDQELLIEIIRQRLIQQRRAELAADIAEARNAYQRFTTGHFLPERAFETPRG